MEPDVLLRTPLAIEECINHEFPDAVVQIDVEGKVLNIAFPQILHLPSGAKVTISTVVSKTWLIEFIEAITQNRFSPEDASQSLETCTTLSGWDEVASAQSKGLQRRQIKQQHGSDTAGSWWSSAVQYITQAATTVGKAVVHVSSIGGEYPPNAQTVVVALNAITAVVACLGRALLAPALGLSALLRVANIVVVAGRSQNPSLEWEQRYAVVDIAIYLLAIPLLLIPGPWGVIASGVVASLPEVGAWRRKCRHDNDPYGLSIFREFSRDPNDIAVARDVFRVPEGEAPDQTAVDQIYDWKYQHCVDLTNRAREREQFFIIELERDEVVFLNQAYITLMGHPRSTGVD